MKCKPRAAETQELRLLRFPKDRICFLPGNENAANQDKAAIADFRRGYISIKTLKRCIEENNQLPEGSISDEAMETFLVSIGEMYEL